MFIHLNMYQLKLGYAHLLGAAPDVFDRVGLTFVETTLREQPEWANSVLPIWLVKIKHAIVCSVAPAYAVAARTAFGAVPLSSLMEPGLVQRGSLAWPGTWIQREILYHPSGTAPPVDTTYNVEFLSAGSPAADALLATFDGGVYVIRDDQNNIVAHAGIKKKGIIHELAVHTQVSFHRQGLGKAVVAYAVAEIVSQGNVPVYIPDTPHNTASYALATTLGFEKAGEMLLCEYALPRWQGFAVL